MLYLIIELTGSTCYSSILYEEPVPIQELKPYLFQSIRQIIRGQEITGDALENSRVKKHNCPVIYAIIKRTNHNC